MSQTAQPAATISVTLARADWLTIEGVLWNYIRDLRREQKTSGWKEKAEQLQRVLGKKLKTDANERFTLNLTWGTVNQLVLMLEDRGRHGAKARLDNQLIEKGESCDSSTENGRKTGSPKRLPRQRTSTNRSRR